MKKMKYLFINLLLWATLSIAYAQPPNDDYANAFNVTNLIGGCSPNAAYTTLNATGDMDPGGCWDTNPDYNVWFKFQAPASGQIKITVDIGGPKGDMLATDIALWENDGITEIKCSKYIYGDDDVVLQYVGLTPNQWYYISVDSEGAPGTFTLCLDDQVDYDYYEGALDVTNLINSCSADAEFTTEGASQDRQAASCWNTYPNYNRWFKFTAPASGVIRVLVDRGGTKGTITHINAAIWEADGITEVACNRYVISDNDVVVQSLNLTPGNTYYISVDNTTDDGRGSFTLCLYDTPDYDFYEGAYDVTSYINSCSAPSEYTTIGATPDRSPASCWNTNPNYNRWFKFQAPATGHIRVIVRRGGANGDITNVNAAIWEADGITEVSCNRYVNSSDEVVVQSNNVTPGQWYYISVDNEGAFSRGAFTLCLYDTLDYDYYEGAYDATSFINSCSSNGQFTTEGATSDRNAASCWNTSPSYNRWFKFQATAPQISITIKRGGSQGSIRNINLALWDSDGLTELACSRYNTSSDEVTVTYGGLTVGNWYYFSVDNYASWARGTFTVCMSDQEKVWTGTQGTDWNDPNNWDPSGVPTNEDVVRIPSSPVGGDVFPETNSGPDAEVYTITIEPKAHVIVPSGKTLTVYANIQLLANSNATGVIIDKNSSNGIYVYGNAISQRYVKGGDYHYISSPIPNVSQNVFNNAYAVYYYDEPSGANDWMAGWLPLNGSLESARGYAAYFISNTMLTFQGSSLHSGDYMIRLHKTNGTEPPERHGWNLIGNPYPSAVDADKFLNENVGLIENAIYYWSDANNDGIYETADYAVWNGTGHTGQGGSLAPDGIIASHQGVMVVTIDDGNRILFTNAMRTLQNEPFFRPQKTIPRIRLMMHDNRYSSEVLVAFREGATRDFDMMYDGRKLSKTNRLVFYAKAGDNKLSIDALSPEELDQKETVVPLFYSTTLAGQKTIQVTQLENLEDNEIYLHDKYTGNMLLLDETGEYSFQSSEGTFTDRFELIFRPLHYKDSSSGMEIAVYPNPVGDKLYIHTKLKEPRDVFIYNTDGKLIYNESNLQGKLQISTVDWPAGVYLVKIVSEDETEVFKIIKK